MGTKTTLRQLKADIRDAADQENSNFVDDPQLVSRINRALARLYDVIIKKDPTFRLETELLDLDSSGRADLPDTFYKVQGVDFYTDGHWVELAEWNFQERNRLKNLAIPRYRLRNDQIEFIPAPGTGAQIQIHFTPLCTPLGDDDDEFDTVNGWHDMVVHQVAIGLKEKEESDTTTLERGLARVEVHVSEMAGDRDYSRPERVTDVNSRIYHGGIDCDWDE